MEAIALVVRSINRDLHVSDDALAFARERLSAAPDLDAAWELAFHATLDETFSKGEHSIGYWFRKARDVIVAAENDGRLVATDDGRFDVASVKKVAPSGRGYGKGRGARYSYAQATMDRLIGFILANPKIADTLLAQRTELDLPYAKIRTSGADTNDVSGEFRRFRAYGVIASGRRLRLIKERRAEIDSYNGPPLEGGAANALERTLAALPGRDQIARMEQNLATWRDVRKAKGNDPRPAE